MTQVNKYTIIFHFIFLFLTYCLLGYDKKEAYANSTTQKKVSSAQKTYKGEDAIKRIKEILESNPDNYEAHYNLGILYEANFMLDEALNAYKKAFLVNPSSEVPLIGQGRILNKKSNYYEAVSIFEKALGINQKRMEIYYYLGITYSKIGKSDDAIKVWQGAIEKSRDKSSINYLNGLIHKEKENNEIAEAFLKKALMIKPEFAAAHKVLEALYSSMGMYGDAYRHAEIHRKINPLL